MSQQWKEVRHTLIPRWDIGEWPGRFVSARYYLGINVTVVCHFEPNHINPPGTVDTPCETPDELRAAMEQAAAWVNANPVAERPE